MRQTRRAKRKNSLRRKQTRRGGNISTQNKIKLSKLQGNLDSLQHFNDIYAKKRNEYLKQLASEKSSKRRHNIMEQLLQITENKNKAKKNIPVHIAELTNQIKKYKEVI